MPSGPTVNNVDIVRQFMSATGDENTSRRRSLMRDDVVVSEAGGLPFSGRYHGPQGFADLLAKIRGVLELQPGPITAERLGDDCVVARFPLTFTSRATGRSVATNVLEIYTLREGLIAELDVYYKDPSAVLALLD